MPTKIDEELRKHATTLCDSANVTNDVYHECVQLLRKSWSEGHARGFSDTKAVDYAISAIGTPNKYEMRRAQFLRGVPLNKRSNFIAIALIIAVDVVLALTAIPLRTGFGLVALIFISVLLMAFLFKKIHQETSYLILAWALGIAITAIGSVLELYALVIALNGVEEKPIVLMSGLMTGSVLLKVVILERLFNQFESYRNLSFSYSYPLLLRAAYAENRLRQVLRSCGRIFSGRE